MARAVELAVAPDERDRLLTQLTEFLDELRAWNARGNLVAPGDLGRLVRRHVIESMAAIPLLDRLSVSDCIDLGAGGGFPGIPLKLARPHLRLALVESRRLKALFLRRVAIKLSLQETWVWSIRAEALAALPAVRGAEGLDCVAQTVTGADAPAARPRVDLLTARAVASIAQLTEWASALVKPGGHLLTYKGSRLGEEMEEWKRKPGPWEFREAIPVGEGTQAVLLRRT